MRLLDYTGSDLVFPGLDLSDREAVVEHMIDAIAGLGLADDPRRLVAEVLAREEVESTAIGGGIAIPHARSTVVGGSRVAIATLRSPVAWGPTEAQNVDVVVLLVGQRGLPAQQLRILARISQLLQNETFLADLRAAQDPAELLELVKAAEDHAI